MQLINHLMCSLRMDYGHLLFTDLFVLLLFFPNMYSLGCLQAVLYLDFLINK